LPSDRFTRITLQSCNRVPGEAGDAFPRRASLARLWRSAPPAAPAAHPAVIQTTTPSRRGEVAIQVARQPPRAQQAVDHATNEQATHPGSAERPQGSQQEAPDGTDERDNDGGQFPAKDRAIEGLLGQSAHPDTE